MVGSAHPTKIALLQLVQDVIRDSNILLFSLFGWLLNPIITGGEDPRILPNKSVLL